MADFHQPRSNPPENWNNWGQSKLKSTEIIINLL